LKSGEPWKSLDAQGLLLNYAGKKQNPKGPEAERNREIDLTVESVDGMGKFFGSVRKGTRQALGKKNGYLQRPVSGRGKDTLAQKRTNAHERRKVACVEAAREKTGGD